MYTTRSSVTRKRTKGGTMVITITYDETYKAAFGNLRYAYRGERTFRRQDDADRFVAFLNDPERVSLFDDESEPRIENLKIVTVD